MLPPRRGAVKLSKAARDRQVALRESSTFRNRRPKQEARSDELIKITRSRWPRRDTIRHRTVVLMYVECALRRRAFCRLPLTADFALDTDA